MEKSRERAQNSDCEDEKEEGTVASSSIRVGLNKLELSGLNDGRKEGDEGEWEVMT